MEMRMKKGDSWCHIPDYSKHTIEETKKGVNITIYTYSGNVHEYICEDKERTKNGEWAKGYREWKKSGLQ